MKTVIGILLILAIEISINGFLFENENPEVRMDVSQILDYHGYTHQDHRVITKDGYVLTLHRIPFGKNDNRPELKPRPAVLLQHGLLDSSHTWINNPPGQGLAYILADSGFDVWMGNVRGSTYSKRHIYLSIHSKEFWKFSFDQIAAYDLPAMIKYILQITKQPKLSYIGHSQGSLMGFALFTERPEMGKLISSFTALGPVATVKDIGLIPSITIKTINKFSFLFNFFRNGEFFPETELVKVIAGKVCTQSTLTSICYNPIFWLAGFDIENINKTRVPIIVSHTPAGTSVQNLKHFYQAHKSGKFQKYDYGSINSNEYHYGQGTPPLYNLTRFNVPLGLIWGGQDLLADPNDVRNLYYYVHDKVKLNKYIYYYNHMDYIWGMDANTVIYPDMIKFIRSQL